MLESASLYIRRNRGKSIIIVLIISIIILGEIVGMLLSNAAEKAEKDAYLYNGPALIIEDKNGDLTKADYDKIRKIDHVTGLGAWKEFIATPMDTENVKDHIGVDPQKKDIRRRADKMVIVANMDVEKYSLFSWEENVSLVEGEFPTYENKGIIVEERYAKKNHLAIGEKVKYLINDNMKESVLEICGIYKIDSDFEILGSNDEGTSVYIHSPYNTIYVDYDYIVKLLNEEYTASTGSEVYVDSFENLNVVEQKLKTVHGDDIDLYDNTSNYLNTECKIVRLLSKMSKLIGVMGIIIGEIILLLTFSYFAIQHQKDTGLFLVLGRTRKWCIGRFTFIGIEYILLGLICGILLYLILGQEICSIISNTSKTVIENSMDRVIGGYDTPGIRQGFEVRISMGLFFSIENILKLFIISVLNWIVFMIFPIKITIEENARKLLNSKG